MSVKDLAQHACIPCKGGVPPLEGHALQELIDELQSDWSCIDAHHLEREYKVNGYAPAVAFANIVARIAEEQDHHPDVMFTWGAVRVTIWTHKINGLTKSDFYFAAKVEDAFNTEHERE